MRVICIDDEYLILQRNMSMLKKIPQVDAIEGFISGSEALEYLKTNSAEVVFLDINMPDINGMELATKIRKEHPDMPIVFLTAYNQFAISAFKIRANGYLLKPVTMEQLEEEILNVAHIMKKKEPRIKVRTFGNFDLFLDGEIVSFSRSIAKEILAYLICKNGTGVSRAELAVVIWEDSLYDRRKQKQLDVYIRSLMNTLKDYNIDNIIEKVGGMLRVRPEYIECDYYQALQGDNEVRKQYFGEFMNNYSWAEYMKAPFM